MKDEALLKRIVLNPRIMTGKPVIKGTRLTVDYILNLLAHGSTEDDIVREYKGISSDDVRACILFAMKSLEKSEFVPLVVEST
ncbi:MAG TPA: DUF433 domain-containing protein [Deltaproteobacteria bacterium]|jgi:uncharacterized protein (DUF433 family)|nr:DUF433 domain-containing protein [Deltaproteobacteria bacterium]OQC22714.1 MAG: hypothetical protein BWX71_02310 [Deltaproteobacteria bacterium ADurb.Bin072]HRW79983.1 DUF433 domain-containing protein [Desulfomonilia bacterium]NMD39817.1 DUF433 domain-containing protein [Deltaproteobacteria bacterium]HNQ85649.1 DUF433 domain-containing protein [Deltaproteobacteria bacterium]